MTPAEEIARDFERFALWFNNLLSAVTPDWVSAAGTLLQGVAVAIGLFFAGKQIEAWRKESLHKRRAQVAEELLATAFQVDDLFKSVRSRLDRIPLDKVNDRKYVYEHRYRRLVEASDIFENLRAKQVMSRPFRFGAVVEQAVDELFFIRNEIVISLEELSDESLQGSRDPEDRKMIVSFRRKVFGSYDANDEVGSRQVGAIRKLEEALSPIIRLE